MKTESVVLLEEIIKKCEHNVLVHRDVEAYIVAVVEEGFSALLDKAQAEGFQKGWRAAFEYDD